VAAWRLRCWQHVFSRQCATLSRDNDTGHQSDPLELEELEAETMSSFLGAEAPEAPEAPSLTLSPMLQGSRQRMHPTQG